ncbi:MAG: tetratricopeptide repeat protein [Deltaproteobacteria bacterium]|jgi:tetratricopeptide (TPR) repeat protein|nr:tetratricopeptide repeat protein [Deltaproteobacteria bacterium]
MAKKYKKTRKELLKEPDEFMTLTGRVIGFAVDHQTQLTYGLGIVLVLAVIVSGIRFFSIRAENKAADMLSQSLIAYSDLENQKSPDELYGAVSGNFQRIVQKYSGKKSGKLARLIYANICYDAGRYKEAIDLYHAALKDFETHAMIHSQILNNLGYAYEQQKDYSTAVSYFEKISEAPEQVLRDEALFHLGRLYGKLGQPEKSKAAYQKIVSDYPDFIYIDMVKEQISG